MTSGDILVLGVLGLIVGCITGRLWKDRKKGSCCGSCHACTGCGRGTEKGSD